MEKNEKKTISFDLVYSFNETVIKNDHAHEHQELKLSFRVDNYNLRQIIAMSIIRVLWNKNNEKSEKTRIRFQIIF